MRIAPAEVGNLQVFHVLDKVCGPTATVNLLTTRSKLEGYSLQVMKAQSACTATVAEQEGGTILPEATEVCPAPSSFADSSETSVLCRNGALNQAFVGYHRHIGR